MMAQVALGARELLALTAGIAADFVESLGDRPVFPDVTAEELREALGGPLPDDPLEAGEVMTRLAAVAGHVTVDRALRLLGLGAPSVVAADEQGRMKPGALRRALGEGGGPAIVCAQAGEVNTGAFDPLGEIADAAEAAEAWLHVDGAFGLWAAVSPRLRHLVAGAERADSWTLDAHKWLNVPYDSGIVFCAHPESHRSAMTVHADYLIQDEGEQRVRDGSIGCPSSRAAPAPFLSTLPCARLGGAV
jgi:pyridoxal-dependent decarboxylase-like protein